jgi:hypothetical protein
LKLENTQNKPVNVITLEIYLKAAATDFKTLPKAFHKYFKEPTQEETWKD